MQLRLLLSQAQRGFVRGRGKKEQKKKIKVICGASKQSILLARLYSPGGSRPVIDCRVLKAISRIYASIEFFLINN